MNSALITKIKLLPLLLLFLLCGRFAASAAGPDEMSYPGFGKLYLYKAVGSPDRVMIFISGDGGWNEGVANMALKVKTANTLVIGVDIRRVLKAMNQKKGNCLYPAEDFEAMSQFVQKKLGYDTYTVPVLIGYSSGATLVYGLLAQGPGNTFRGGIAFGFCPDIAVNKAFCKGSGEFTSQKRRDGKGFDLGQAKRLAVPFISLQGMTDQICDYGTTVAFLRNVPGSEVISLPKVGHGYSVEDNWVPQFKRAYDSLFKKAPEDSPVTGPANMPELPLKITPAAKGLNGNTLVLLISGDGGFTGFDQQVADLYASRGMPVIGLNSLKYFWKKKSPQQTASDILNLLKAYMEPWKKERVVLVGYSFGADVLPFVYNLLPPDFKQRVAHIALLSPSKSTDFEIHVSDLFDFASSSRTYSVTAEIEKVDRSKLTCFFGKAENDTAAPELLQKDIRVVFLDGGHHYSDDLETILKRSLL
jgi:type IV secretory pathway VirJ component